MGNKNIVLIGFMGSGKTTVAKTLKRATGMEIIDTDYEIVKKAGMKIPEIFEKYGENHFRELETNLLRELEGRENLIVSCGGGIVLREENVEAMQKVGTVVLLSATAETTYHRVKRNNNRPLLKGKMNIKAIQEMMDARQAYYERAAQIIVHVDFKGLKYVSQEIIKKVGAREVNHV